MARGGAGAVGRGKSTSPGTRGDWSGSCGGGGSGGAILIRTTASLTFRPAAVLNVTGGTGGRPGTTTDDQYLTSEYYPIGGDGGRGRIRLEVGEGITMTDLVLVIVEPTGTVPSLSSVFQGDEVITHVWSKPFSLRGGTANSITAIDALVDIDAVVADLVQTQFTSPIVRWEVLLDGGENKSGTDVEPDRLFGPLDNFENLLGVGLKPGSFRFLISFVASADTGETAQVDTLTVPVEAVQYTTP
jgi:hypothetical protein